MKIDHELDIYNKVSTPFSSKKIKYLYKKWKHNNYLNVGKLVSIFGNNSEGFIDFTKQKKNNINKVVQTNYLASSQPKRLLIMNNLISKLKLSKQCKVFRVLDDKYSIVMKKKI